MRRLSRLRAPIERVRAPRSQSGYQCLQCRLQFAPFSSSVRSGKEVQPLENQDEAGSNELVTGGEKHVAEARDKRVDLPPVPEMITPATTWANLDWIATPHWIEMKRASAMKIETFGDLQNPLTDRQAIRDAVMKSTIEVLLLQEHHHPLQELSTIPTDFGWPTNVGLGIEDGKAVVKFPSEKAKVYLWEVLATGVEPASTKTGRNTAESVSPEPFLSEPLAAEPVGTASIEAERIEPGNNIPRDAQVEFYGPGSDGTAPESQAVKVLEIENQKVPSWHAISLEDTQFKFALYKRILQRTGIRLPDRSIAQAATAGALFDLLWSPPPPKKLAEWIAQKSELSTIPNVAVSPRRIGLIGKETAIGRWKIIEQELQDRDLPVSGPAI